MPGPRDFHRVWALVVALAGSLSGKRYLTSASTIGSRELSASICPELTSPFRETPLNRNSSTGPLGLLLRFLAMSSVSAFVPLAVPVELLRSPRKLSS